MTIQDLGSIGELIAAIATVATLAYLAVQIRQNTLSNRDANVRATHDMILRVNSAVIDNPEMADLLIRGAAGPGNLDPPESALYHIGFMRTPVPSLGLLPASTSQAQETPTLGDRLGVYDVIAAFTDDILLRLRADPTLRFSENFRACGRRGRGGPLNRGA